MKSHSALDNTRGGKLCNTVYGKKRLNGKISYVVLKMVRSDTEQFSNYPQLFLFPRCTSVWSDTVNLAKLWPLLFTPDAL